MKVRDEAAWQQLLADFASDANPLAPELHGFTLAWADKAENWLEQADWEQGNDPKAPQTPMECLRTTLAFVEVTRGEHVTIGMVGATLVLLTIHWAYGEDLFDQMTPIEKRLVEDSVMIKMLQLNAQAQEGHDE